MTAHQFGGTWTSDKLERIRAYLREYRKIFSRSEKARFYQTWYVDAFAGTGSRVDSRDDSLNEPYLLRDPDARSLLQGSARIALEIDPPFDHYLFIDKQAIHVQQLEKLKTEFPVLADRIDIRCAEANAYLAEWCHRTDWRTHRAVVFLDPYGMQVDWSLLTAIAETKSIDLWLLFPLAVAVNRLLTRDEPPPRDWANALDRFLGTTDWREAFYPRRKEETLFGPEISQQKEADFESIGQYFVRRLKTIFPAVAPNPHALRSSTGIPLYLLCFAASNEKGAPIALRIAQHILKG